MNLIEEARKKIEDIRETKYPDGINNGFSPIADKVFSEIETKHRELQQELYNKLLSYQHMLTHSSKTLNEAGKAFLEKLNAYLVKYGPTLQGSEEYGGVGRGPAAQIRSEAFSAAAYGPEISELKSYTPSFSVKIDEIIKKHYDMPDIDEALAKAASEYINSAATMQEAEVRACDIAGVYKENEMRYRDSYGESYNFNYETPNVSVFTDKSFPAAIATQDAVSISFKLDRDSETVKYYDTGHDAYVSVKPDSFELIVTEFETPDDAYFDHYDIVFDNEEGVYEGTSGPISDADPTPTEAYACSSDGMNVAFERSHYNFGATEAVIKITYEGPDAAEKLAALLKDNSLLRDETIKTLDKDSLGLIQQINNIPYDMVVELTKAQTIEKKSVVEKIEDIKQKQPEKPSDALDGGALDAKVTDHSFVME